MSGDGCTELDQCFSQKVEFGESWSLWSLSMCKVSPCSQPLNQSSSNEKLSDFSWWPTPIVTIGSIAACSGLMVPRINHWVNTRTSFPSLFLSLHKIEFGIDSNQIIQMPAI